MAKPRVMVVAPDARELAKQVEEELAVALRRDRRVGHVGHRRREHP